VTDFLDGNFSITGRRWKLRECDERIAEAIAQRHSIPEVAARVMSARGVTLQEAGSYLEPKIKNLMPDPYVLKDMEKAVNRIADAIYGGEKVAIFGDYDVDGATSSALLKKFFNYVGTPAIVHIPEREDGYGPEFGAMKNFLKKGVSLVVTVDCGITAFDVIDRAVDIGLDIVVADHHEAEARLPNAVAVVNPKRLDEDNESTLRYMAACGVVFMLVVGLNRELRKRGFYQQKNIKAPNIMNWLDVVALGTVCDMVPLRYLNRAFVKQGLKVASARGNVGLTALFDEAKVDEPPSAFHLGYLLGPRINACGRIGDSSIGSRLLYENEIGVAKEIAEKLTAYNEERKEIEAAVLYEAIEQVESTDSERGVVFAYGNNWHAGVIGIVSGRLKERYQLPACVMAIGEDGEVKGSGRSVVGVDLGAAIIAAKQKGILTAGGGHVMAAGFSLKEEKLEEFMDFIEEHIKKQTGGKKPVAVLEIDAALDVMGVTYDLVESLDLMAPFGVGNAEPKVVVTNVSVSKSDVVGTGHVRCYLSGQGGGSIKAIAFREADSELGHLLLNHGGRSFNIVGNIRPDRWRGRENVQLVISDAVAIN
jgi:single-stranded-DNA-specific exonuclease